jgi:hypothetical protein
MIGHRPVLIVKVRPQLKQKSTRFKQTPLRFGAIHAIFVKLVECERLEHQFANAGEASADDLDCYGRISGNMRRLLEAVGLQRRSRDATPPDPLDYARQQTS